MFALGSRVRENNNIASSGYIGYRGAYPASFPVNARFARGFVPPLLHAREELILRILVARLYTACAIFRLKVYGMNDALKPSFLFFSYWFFFLLNTCDDIQGVIEMENTFVLIRRGIRGMVLVFVSCCLY